MCFIDVSSSSIRTGKTCVTHVDRTSHSVSCSAIPQWARRFPKLALTIRNWHPCFSFFWNAWEEWKNDRRQTDSTILLVGFSNIISMEFNQLFPHVPVPFPTSSHEIPTSNLFVKIWFVQCFFFPGNHECLPGSRVTIGISSLSGNSQCSHE